MTDGGIVALVLTISGVIVALTNIFKPFKAIKRYWDSRRARIAAMTKVGDRLDSIDQQLRTMDDRQKTIAMDLKETIDHNRRQDTEIKRSLEQRQIHDGALFALLDASHKAGNNGPVTRARQALLDHMQKEANAPINRKE